MNEPKQMASTGHCVGLDICPYCGSDNLRDVIDYLHPEDPEAPDIIECLDCNNTWEVKPPAEEVKEKTE